MKNMKRIVSLLLTVMMVCGMFSMAFASEFGDEGNEQINGVAKKVAGTVISLLKVIAYAIAFGMLVFIGIKYMTKGAGAKAEVKDTLLPYLIGAVLVAAAATIADAVMSMSF